MKKKILVTGGAGYVGSRLVPTLLVHGYDVVVYDTFWFGDYLDDDPSLIKVKDDIRNTRSFMDVLAAYGPFDVVLHMACISNDPSAELDQGLSEEINLTCFEPLIAAAKAAGTKRFVFCSTSSVYGISDAPRVTEDHPRMPITLYNTTKAKCEDVVWKYHSDEFPCVVVRPSTICGYAPRQRLDLAVNILTNLAVNKGEIVVFGGEQKRPNLHIDDMVDAYLAIFEAPTEKVAGQAFNVGAKNSTINELATMVAEVVHEEVNKTVSVRWEPMNDPRSYQVDSSKIADVLGFKPKYSVEQAVRDLCSAFQEGWLPNPLEDARYFNVKRMREVWADLYKDAPPSTFDPTKGILSEIDLLRGARAN